MSLYQALKDFAKQDRVRFHIPGHKGGRGLSKAWMADAFMLDVTEFDETDDLQHPIGVLKTAQDRAAEVFGAQRSFYITNGSTQGLQAAILAACREKKKILVDRTCHKSVISALVLSGAEPIFISPRFDRARGLYVGFTPSMIKAAVENEPNLAGMLLVSPTYYGVCSAVSEVAEYLHSTGRFLIVDEAHGAHFCFDSSFPGSAMAQGADVVIQSAHKTLPALGQCSLLHVGRASMIQPQAVEAALHLLQTTSPSYLLMSALEESIEQMCNVSLAPQIEAVRRLKQRVRGAGVLDFADTETLGCGQDPLRLTIDFRGCAVRGTEAAVCLKQDFGIYPEMADENYVVCIVTAADTQADLAALERALLSFTQKAKDRGRSAVPLPDIQMAVLPRTAWESPSCAVPCDRAIGRIAARTMAVCPPGAALLVCGQRVDEQTVAYIKEHLPCQEIMVMDQERG